MVLALLTTAFGRPVFGGRGADLIMVRHHAIRSFHPSFSHSPSCSLLGLFPFPTNSVLLLLHGWSRGRAWAPHSWTCLLHSTWSAKRICITQFLCTGLKNLLSGKANPQAHSQGAARSMSLFLLQSVEKPFQHLYPLKAACTKSSHLTLFFSIIGAEQAPFLVKYHLQLLAKFYCPFLDFLHLFNSLQRSTDLSLAHKMLRTKLLSTAGALLLLLAQPKVVMSVLTKASQQ